MLASQSAPIANVEITAALKLALKNHGITYKQVAEKLGVSEKTVKRLFQDKDCSLTRLHDICEMMDMTIYDLLDFSRHYQEPLITLSDRQEAYLQGHPHHFSFLFFLIIGHGVDEIQAQYGLSDLGIFRYLRDLDREGFIELGAHNQFRLRIEGRMLMSVRGPLGKLIKARNQLFFDHVFDQPDDEDAAVYGVYRFMDTQTYSDLQEELEALVKKYRKRAQQNEMVLPRERLIPVKFVSMIGEYAVCGAWPLPELDT